MATLRELIVKIAFKIDDAVLKKSTAKTNEILSKQKKSFEKTEEAITKSKQTAHDRRKKLEMAYSDWWNKELSKRQKVEQIKTGKRAKEEKLANENPELEFIIPIHPNPNIQKYKHLSSTMRAPYQTQIRQLQIDVPGLRECHFFPEQ
jgi:hypothetical protein